MTTAAVAPMLVAMGTAVGTLLCRRFPRLQRSLSVLGSVAFLLVVAHLLDRVVFAAGPGTTAPQILTYQLGGWPAPFGITLVADGLSVFMLSMTAVVAVFAVAVSVRSIAPAHQRTYYHPLFHFLLLGVAGAFLTGDLFNLFVWFEVMLMASYAFVAFYGKASHTAAAMRYLVLNMLGGFLMLLAIGGLYATVGTLNMADMARLLAADTTGRSAPVLALSGFIFATFALKAGLVPFQFWVPSAYRAAPLPVVAMFAGATKKVGMYAIIRLYFTVFGDATVPTTLSGIDAGAPLAFLAPVLLVMGLLSIAVGGLGAIGADSLDGLLAYSSIGQVGFIAIPVAVAAASTTPAARHLGVLAGLLYALHHAVTKALLFLSAAVVREGVGTTDLAALGGLGRDSPIFAGVLFVGSLSLIGIPPLAGFFGKLFVFLSAVDGLLQTPSVGRGVVLLGLVVGAILTIVYATRLWVDHVWGAPAGPVAVASYDRTLVAIVAAMAAVVVLIGIGFEPVYRMADAAASAAIDTDAYVTAVDPGGAGS